MFHRVGKHDTVTQSFMSEISAFYKVGIKQQNETDSDFGR